ncbi:MAG: 50S ribosomal protein L17 [Phycisphaerae bacterium]|nr:50S ribosomal protein L17 [Phycisphaerae bacterium]
MRHRIHGKQLCRDSEHRTAMLRNLAAGLFEHGQIETTMPKAKAVQPFVEKIITIAKRGGLNSRRRIEQLINDRKIHAWVADPNVPDSKKHNDFFDLPDEDAIEFNRYGEVRKAPRLVQHIMTAVAPRYADRDGGYTRIVKIGKHRLGDGTDLVILQLVGEEDGPQLGGSDSRRRMQKQRRRDFAAKVLASVPAEEAVVEDAEVVADAEAVTEEAVVEETAVEEAVTEEATEETTEETAPAEESAEESAEADDASADASDDEAAKE